MGEQENTLTGRRKAPRLRVRLAGSGVTRNGTSKVTILNISRHGALVEMQEPMTDAVVGKEMVVFRPSFEVFGEIRRAQGHYVAIEFDEEITHDELVRLRAVSERQPLLSQETQWMRQARDWVCGVGGRAGMD